MRYKISHYIHRFIDNGKALLWSQRYILLSSTLWCWTKRFDIRSKVSDFYEFYLVCCFWHYLNKWWGWIQMNAAIFANTIRLFNTIQIKNYFLIVEALTELNRHLSFFKWKLYDTVCLLFKVTSTRYLPKSVSHECICNTSFLCA